jgi:hypothetical protein
LSQPAERNLRRILREVIREELTSGDPKTRRLLTELPFSLVLRDSEGSELSSYIRNLDVPLSSRASEATLSNILGRLDVTLSSLSRLIRWGRDVSPIWVHGSERSAPPAGSALVSWTVPAGKVGYIYGFFISAGEANDFRINWTSDNLTYSRRIALPGKGTLHFVDVIPINEGLPASGGTNVTITNVHPGSTGVIYQAALLVVAV